MAGERAQHEPLMRTPDTVLRLDRMGSAHQTRLSFLRALLRRAARECWRFTRPRFDIDARGVGTAIYQVDTGPRTYSLVCFGHDLPADKRTDRVIAEAWDATFALFDGIPTPADIERLFANVPRQEAGRYLSSELVLARANRSVRLFDHVVEALAAGAQPDQEAVETIGYLMRTTAVYGNGKFGIADRDRIQHRAELSGPFRAEMLTVYLIRAFTVDLAEHMARLRAPDRAVALLPELRRRFGVGNATGLGMAPFLVRHPLLLHRWISARETALARVRALAQSSETTRARFLAALASGRSLVARWRTDDPVQAPRIPVLAARSRAPRTAAARQHVAQRCTSMGRRSIAGPSVSLSLEGQEFVVTLLLEPHGSLVDDLADQMSADEAAVFDIDGAQNCGDLLAAIDGCYRWALATDFTRPDQAALFWYVSEEKLEPRLGVRADEPGAELEQPLAVARDVAALRAALQSQPPETMVGAFLLRSPEHRHTARRVQVLARHPYAEIRDNLIGRDMRAVDILRCKLAFFGVTRFDPRSDKWLRITLCQGRALPRRNCRARLGRLDLARHDRIAQRGREPQPEGVPRRRHELGFGRRSRPGRPLARRPSVGVGPVACRAPGAAR